MKRLVLLGGGHAHAFLLNELRTKPLAGAAITLVSPYPVQTYSGMLPGLIAGHYSAPDLQIDLARLSRETGAVLLLDRAVGLDAAKRIVHLERSGEIPYDLLSLNTGSVTDTRVPGSAEFALPAKPFEPFLHRWESARESAKRFAVAGSGAAGVELAMAIRFRRPDAPVVLFSERSMFEGRFAGRIRDALARCGVELRPGAPVEKLERGPVLRANGKDEAFDLVIWSTGATAEPWLARSGLAVDERGFVLVDRALRSVSHPAVFAAGDAATLRDAPHPKSGVYAVRHAPVLLGNLRRTLRGEPALAYAPQRDQLALISCGGKYAIASRGRWSAEGAWAWRWKDWLDRRWIARFR